MPIRKLTNKGRAVVTAGLMLSGMVGSSFIAPVANADVYSSYTLQVAASGANPVAPRFFEGFANTVNFGGSETAEYAMETVGSLYNNAGIFGCNQNGDKRTCSTSSGVLPSTDIYDNYDHNIVVQGLAVGSAVGAQDLCNEEGVSAPSEPTTLPSAPPYYTYPVEGSTTGANGIPIDLVRASASLADLALHGDNFSNCTDIAQQGIASDAVIGLTFNPVLPDGTAVEDPANTPINPATGSPYSIDFSNVGGPGSSTDTAYRVFCDTGNDPLAITTWDQLYEAEGIPDAPSPDQPLVLFGPKNNSGTGATWYDFAGCGTGTGRILTNHLVTENDAQQISQYAAQDSSTDSIPTNTTGCNSSTVFNGSPEPCSPAVTGASVSSYPVDCGNGTTSTGLGTAAYNGTVPTNSSETVESCVAQEVADSIFFMSYGYYISHTYTASVTIPTPTVGDQPNYINNASNYQVAGTATTIGGQAVSGPYLGNPTAVTTDARAGNANAVATGRDLWIDYLANHVRASAAGFVNWVCDAGNHIAPKGLDLTTGKALDTEISTAITAWGWGRLNCDGGSGNTYSPTIATGGYQTVGGVQVWEGPVIDPGPPNNE